MTRLLLILLLLSSQLHAQKTIFEESNGTRTSNYSELINWWSRVDARSSMINMIDGGPTDAGINLKVVIINNKGLKQPPPLGKRTAPVWLINNGIHPGEPDGIDASMLLARDIADGKIKLRDNVFIIIIPAYNIGGMQLRGTKFRVDQNGPIEIGSRGNSQNLDLNRDFIKTDSRESASFQKIFTRFDPDLFMDTHVSNGADYQHVMTLLSTHYNKLAAPLSKLLHDTLEPQIYQAMEKQGYPLIPYVNHFGDEPEKGWLGFWDSPRYSSGYASLFHTIGFMPETHMLKPYKQRVEATLAMQKILLSYLNEHGTQLLKARREAFAQTHSLDTDAIRWKPDSSEPAKIRFNGYQVSHPNSTVSGQPRIFYDRNKPYSTDVTYYNLFRPVSQAAIPERYIIPQGWHQVIDRLKNNKVLMSQLAHDTVMEVKVYRIKNYQSSPQAYEGHHRNTLLALDSSIETVWFQRGDYVINSHQRARHYLSQTLNPWGEDSFFSWNFFDVILQQKEGYSDYHFEDVIAEELTKRPELRAALDEAIKKDPALKADGGRQLDFLFGRAGYLEERFLRYPVFMQSIEMTQGRHQQLSAPPLGWNSWDSYGMYPTEAAMMANIKTFERKLRPVGYQYFVIDAGWNKIKNESGAIVSMSFDEYARYIPNPATFPHGFESIANELHAKNLKFGVHIMRGVSRLAWQQNLPILGTPYHVRDIADTNSKCKWNNDNYGVDMTRPGAQAYYDSYIQSLADRGVDFIKADDIAGFPNEIDAIVRSIAKTGRRIILSLSPGGDSRPEYFRSYANADMLRVTKDIWDDQVGIDRVFTAWNTWGKVDHAGFWLDMDMIPFGHLCLHNPDPNWKTAREDPKLNGIKQKEHFSFFDINQKKTFMAMRALSASPLMMGGDLPTSDEMSFKLITNPDMLACNQNGIVAEKYYAKNGIEIWRVADKNNRDRGWLGIFNRNLESSAIEAGTNEVGLNGVNISWRNIWEGGSGSMAAKGQKFVLPGNGVAFLSYKIEP